MYNDIIAEFQYNRLRNHYLDNQFHGGLDFEAFALANIYFLTVMFAHTERRPENALSQYKRMHFQFLQHLVGPKVFRHLDIQPVGFCFVDFEGSRTGNSQDGSLPHIHSLMMINPTTRSRLDEIISDEPLFKGAELYNPAKSDLKSLASYCSKGLFGSLGEFHGRGELWDTFPFITSKTIHKGGRQL
jgi:hypothetical protein